MEENKTHNVQNSNQQIAAAIIVAGLIIAGAILLKGNSAQKGAAGNDTGNSATAIKIEKNDRTQGNPNAKVALVLYEDFQCPFCGAVSGLVTDSDAIKYLKEKVDPNWAPFMPAVNDYIKNGSVLFVYRDYAFLGPESIQSAEAARCAGDQGKFWEYHDYLYSHQKGENQGSFSNPNLESFAQGLGLNSATFNQCLESGKYLQAVNDAKVQATNVGVTGTPKGFILRDGKVVATIDGAEPLSMVKPKIENALK